MAADERADSSEKTFRPPGPSFLMAAGAFDLSQLPQGWQPIPERIPSSLTDSNRSTTQTVVRMCELIGEAQSDELLRGIAARLGRWGFQDNRAVHVCWDAFWLCKHRVRFLVDEAAVAVLFNERDQVDFLISPSVLLRMHNPAGDCDDFTMLCCTLLSLCGVGWEIVTVAVDPREPGRWSHVYLRAILPDGRRLVLDPTNGPYPGWEIPSRDIQRKQVFDMRGNAVQDSAPVIRDLRMHAYLPRHRGVGYIDPETEQEVQFGGGGGTTQTDLTPWITAGVPLPSSPLPTTAATQPSWWDTFTRSGAFSQLATIGSRLGTIALTPRGATVQQPGLLVSNQGPFTGAIGGGFSIGWIVFAAVGIGVIAMVASSGGRR